MHEVFGEYKISVASLGLSNNGAVKQQKMWCCRDEIWGGWDLLERAMGAMGTRGRRVHGLR